MNAPLSSGFCQVAEGLFPAYLETLKRKAITARAQRHGIGLGFAEIPEAAALLWPADVNSELAGIKAPVIVAGSAKAAAKLLGRVLRGEA